MSAAVLSKKKKFAADGVFYAELNSFLSRELAEDGYAGVEVRKTPMRTEIIIRATRTQNVLGEKGRRIRELACLVQRRFGFPKENVELYAERVQNRALCAIAQAESVRYKLLEGLAVRRACYGVLRYIMENGAKGVEIIITGKLRGARAKSMKFKDGYMIKSGDAVNHYVDTAIRHVNLKQGVLGIKVRIQLPYDESGKEGSSIPLPDVVTVKEPKPDPTPSMLQSQPQQPYVEQQLPVQPQAMAPQGMPPQGIPPQPMQPQAMPPQAYPQQVMPPQQPQGAYITPQ